MRGHGPQEMSKTSRRTKLGTVGNAGSNKGDDSSGKSVVGWPQKRRPWHQRGETKSGKTRTSPKRGALDFHSREVGTHDATGAKSLQTRQKRRYGL